MSRNARTLPADIIVKARMEFFAALDFWADAHTTGAQRRVREALAEISRLEHQPAD